MTYRPGQYLDEFFARVTAAPSAEEEPDYVPGQYLARFFQGWQESPVYQPTDSDRDAAAQRMAGALARSQEVLDAAQPPPNPFFNFEKGVAATVANRALDMARDIPEAVENIGPMIRGAGRTGGPFDFLVRPATDVAAAVLGPIGETVAAPFVDSAERMRADEIGQALAQMEAEARHHASGLGRFGMDVAGVAPQIGSMAAFPELAPSLMFAQGAGSGIREAEAAGATPEQTAHAGLLSGAVEAGSEMLPFGTLKRLANVLDGPALETLAQVGKRIAVQAGEEGAEEVLASIGQEIVQRSTYRQGEPLGLVDVLDILEQAGYEGLVGAAAGGAIGSVSAAHSYDPESFQRERDRREAYVDQLNRELAEDEARIQALSERRDAEKLGEFSLGLADQAVAKEIASLRSLQSQSIVNANEAEAKLEESGRELAERSLPIAEEAQGKLERRRQGTDELIGGLRKELGAENPTPESRLAILARQFGLELGDLNLIDQPIKGPEPGPEPPSVEQAAETATRLQETPSKAASEYTATDLEPQNTKKGFRPGHFLGFITLSDGTVANLYSTGTKEGSGTPTEFEVWTADGTKLSKKLPRTFSKDEFEVKGRTPGGHGHGDVATFIWKNAAPTTPTPEGSLPGNSETQEPRVYRMTPEEIAAEHDARVAARKKSAQGAQQGRPEAASNPVDEYVAGKDGLRAASERTTLSKVVNNAKRGAMPRAKLIEALVEEGATVGTAEGAPALVSPDGSYLRAREATKTGIEYARWLIEQKSPERSLPNNSEGPESEGIAVEVMKPGAKGIERQRTDKRIKRWGISMRPAGNPGNDPQSGEFQRLIDYRTQTAMGYNRAEKKGAEEDVLDAIRAEYDWVVDQLSRSPEGRRVLYGFDRSVEVGDPFDPQEGDPRGFPKDIRGGDKNARKRINYVTRRFGELEFTKERSNLSEQEWEDQWDPEKRGQGNSWDQHQEAAKRYVRPLYNYLENQGHRKTVAEAHKGAVAAFKLPKHVGESTVEETLDRMAALGFIWKAEYQGKTVYGALRAPLPDGAKVLVEPSQPIDIDQEIKKAPQAEAQEPARPAPAPKPKRPELPDLNPELGEEQSVYTKPGSEPFKARFAVIDIDNLTTSHDIDGRVNPAFPEEKQPRDRTRAGSRLQIEEIAKTLNPFVLDRSHFAQDGAPIVNRQGVVISGNGRVNALRLAREINPQQAGYYKNDAVIAKLERFGLSKDAAKGMRFPVLVRVLEDPSIELQISEEANVDNTARLSPVEQGIQDGKKITTELLDRMRLTEEGEWGREFEQAFLEEIVPSSQRASLLDDDGDLNNDGTRRITAALLAHAYGDKEVLSKAVESKSSSIRQVTKAMAAAAPRIAKMKAAMESGDRHSDYDLTTDLLNAVAKLVALKKEGIKVNDYLNQGALTGRELTPEAEEFLRIIGDRQKGTVATSQKRMAEFFLAYADRVDNVGSPKQGGLFGADTLPEMLDLIEGAEQDALGGKNLLDDQDGGGMFASKGRYAVTLGAAEAPAIPGGNRPYTKGQAEGIPPGSSGLLRLALPELIELVEAIGEGKLPEIKRSLGKALAHYSPAGRVIRARADLFSDPDQVLGIMAHEIGHFIDDLQDWKIGQRGNILGRIATLERYMRETLAKLPDRPTLDFDAAEQKLVRRQAIKNVGKRPGKKATDADKKAYGKAVAKEYARLKQEWMDQHGQVSRSKITEELKEVSEAWRPGLKGATGAYAAYRNKSEELYADAFSMLLNDPDRLKRMAPTYFNVLQNYLPKKPEVTDALDLLQARGQKGADAIDSMRERRQRQMFDEGRDDLVKSLIEKPEENTKKLLYDEFMTLMVESNHAIYQMRNRVRKAGNKAAEALGNRAIRLLEELASGNSGAVYYFSQVSRTILKPLADNKVSADDVGALLFNERISKGDRSKLANPLGFDPESAQRQVDRLEKRLGPEKMKVIRKALKDYREQVRRPVLQRYIDSGAASPELIAAFAKNEDHYVRFEVTEHLKDEDRALAGGLSSLRSQIGTFKRVADPLLATAMHDMVLLRVADRALAARAVADFAQAVGVVEKPKKQWTGRGYRYLEPADPKKSLLRYLSGGKVKAVVVPKGWAKAFQRDPSSMSETAKFYQKWFHAPVRGGFVTHNPGFAIWNIQKDSRAFFKNLPGWSPLKRAVAITESALEIWEAMKKGEFSATELEMLLHKGLYAPGRKIWGGQANNSEEAFALLQERIGARDESVYAARNEVQKWVHRIGRALSFGSELTERTVKTAGWKYIEKKMPQLSLDERAELVRNRTGTPNTLRRGEAFHLYNNIWLFSNVAKEGIRQSYTAARDNPAEYIAKTVAMDVMPKLLMAAAAAGALGEDWEEFWSRIPEYQKAMYSIIPLGTWNGQSVYIPLPHDHAGQIMGAITWKMAQEDGVGVEDVLNVIGDNLMPWGAGQITPWVEATQHIRSYMTGRNPYDAYRGRLLLTPQEFDAGGWQAWKKVLKASWNEIGSPIYRFKASSRNEIKTELEKVLGVPFLGGLLSRLIRTTDAGLYEREGAHQKAERREAARTAINRDEAIRSILRENPTKSAAAIERILDRQGIDDGYKRRGNLKRRIEKLREEVTPQRRK